MSYTNKDIEMISKVYKNKGVCTALVCDYCPLGIYYRTICTYDIAYDLAKDIIEVNTELFFEELL